MATTSVRARFDGEVLRPETPLELERDVVYEITIDGPPAMPEVASESTEGGTAWDVLDHFAGSVEGPGDLSSELDHYLYGSPKLGENAT